MVWNTFRNPKETPFHWKENLNYKKIQDIQSVCVQAMKLWGYRMVDSETDLKVIEPLEKLVLTEEI